MTAKSFIGLLIAAVTLGGGLGASFAGGLAVGKNQVEASTIPPTAELVAPTNSDPTVDDSAGSVADQLQDLRERISRGEQPSAEELQLLREQFQRQTGDDFRGQGGGFAGAGGGGLTGTIEGVEGNVITVNTGQGPLHAVIDDETVIQRLAVIGPDDLLEGLQVTVVGTRNDAGELEATSIFMVPEGGLAGLFAGGGGGFGGGRGFGAGGFGGGTGGAGS